MAMGSLQGFIHKTAYGKPKATGVDAWDRSLEKRDTALKTQNEEEKVSLLLECKPSALSLLYWALYFSTLQSTMC